MSITIALLFGFGGSLIGASLVAWFIDYVIRKQNEAGDDRSR